MCIVCLTVSSVVAVAMSLTLSSCSKKEESAKLGNIDAKGQVIPADLPDWVANPYSGLNPGTLAGVGISSPPGAGSQLKYLIMQAESQARAEIATTLESEISRVIKEATQSVSAANMNAAESSFSAVTQEVVKNVRVSGAVRDKIYQDKSGVVYVRAIVDSAVVKKYLTDSVENYSKAMQSAGFSNATIQKTNASLKHLFDDLEAKTGSQKAL